MNRRLLAVTLAIGAVCTAAPAGAADPVKPLRVIVYDVSYASTTVRREKTSGFDANGMSGGGSPFVEHRFSSDDAGALTISIVAATPDGGLVADCAFTGKNYTQPTVRVAIFKDGRLSFDPHASLVPEATALLPLLSRGLVADRTIDVASSWSVPAAQPATGETTYKVVSIDGARAKLGIQSAISVKAPPPFTESTTGEMVYTTDVLSPVSLDLHSTVRRTVNGDQSDTVDSYVTAKLRSDTFAKQ